MGKIEETIAKIKGVDPALLDEAQKRLDNLTKPQGSLGKLEDTAKKVVGATGEKNPSTKRKVIFTMAGDHGVVAEGVSAFPQEVTPQMVYNFLNGGAGVNVLARLAGARVVVVDIGVATDLNPHPYLIVKKVKYGTANIAKGPAMTREEAIKSIENGIDVFEEEFKNGIDIAGMGDMGIGNTTPSAALASVITGSRVEDITGRGTGISDEALLNKIDVIKRAIDINKPDPNDAIDVLAKVGGLEIGGIAGVILAAAAHRVPVVVDGFISGAAMLIAYKLEPSVKDYIIAAHSSVERGHKAILDYVGVEPLLDLGLRLGEGTGAALAFGIIEASLKILAEMATFESAAVSEKI
ncbi:MAG: nicotinate-nucleotide--dimethylbenzimidazole phosphoribosyltransferase [Nitrospinae bacterium]|nr:nicotinate-nucleotide--dimethylbenzimidazole phosphoribosyltransferase [Nitrospinota bacterium]